MQLVPWLCRGGRKSVLFGDTGCKETTEEAQGKGEDEEERAGQGVCVGGEEEGEGEGG